ncbi:Gfo/Idh/MocA family protein [Chthonomonas calidirosea]|uniref:Gfo/Idh/MocA family protein n=1 Tax=Chthonomonas calidirosea TaxID=454171 RepID=UPI0012E37450|nr:Gfo/Idh/MocA family oxidoreductase [Chthonomonas calidirosea]
MAEDGKIGVAMLSFAHVHARDYASQIESNPHLKLVAVWDEDPARGRMEAERRGVPFYAELDQVLNLAEVEAVVVNAPTFMHRDILVAAAQAKKHIFTEKALTITVQEATEVMRAVEDAGIRFMISLPSRTRPEILFAKKLIDENYLGDITLMRARVAHMAALDRWFSGGSAWFGEESKAGGGAFFDLGCHRVDIMRWFLGEPASVVAQMTNFSGAYEVDDNMVATVTFRSGAIGILDVSWVHRYGPNPLEIYGTQGYLGIDQGPAGPRIQLISQRVTSGEIQGCVTPSPSSLPKALPSPMEQWVNAIREGTTPTINIYDAWALTQMLENCYKAAREHREVVF